MQPVFPSMPLCRASRGKSGHLMICHNSGININENANIVLVSNRFERLVSAPTGSLVHTVENNNGHGMTT